MRKSRIFALLMSAVLVVGALFIALTPVSVSAASKVVDSDFIKSPTNSKEGYAYSFAVIGDTQNLNLHDVDGSLPSGTNNMETLYRWILNNKSTKNIQFAVGLGDITQTFKSSEDENSIYAKEWQNAKNALSIIDGKIPYSLVRGNHDISGGLNATFGSSDSAYYKSLTSLAAENDSFGRPKAGILEDGKIETTYQKLEIKVSAEVTHRYLIMTFDWGLTDEALAWADKVISENPEYKVIATIHQFLTNDGCVTDAIDGTVPGDNALDANWGETETGGTGLPRELWENVLSKYSNVEMILSGHVDTDDILTTQLRGDNGNTVTAMLIDPQSIDLVRTNSDGSVAFPGNVGMVAMFYFSADGNVLDVEYISTVRDTNGENAYLKETNQFEVKLEYENGWTETPHGYAPTDDYNKYPFLVFSDDDSDPENYSFYLGGYGQWVGADKASGALYAAKVYFDKGGLSARKHKTLNIVMTPEYNAESGTYSARTYDASGDGSYNKMHGVAGVINLNLGGNTFKTGKYPALYAYASYADRVPTFNVINGNVSIGGGEAFAVLMTNVSSAANNSAEVSLNFKDVTFSYGGGSAAATAVTTWGGNAEYNSRATVTATDCVFDLNTETSHTVFALADPDSVDNNYVTLKINGGTVYGASAANPAIFTADEGRDNVIFGEGEDGYLKLVLPVGAAAPLAVYKNASGERYTFILANEGETSDEYTLAPVPSRGTIDVYLIGGQSNAAGYGSGTLTDAINDKRYTEGFENVLYYGQGDENAFTDFTPVMIGQGCKSDRTGAEIGIASALGDGDGYAAVIKYARGSSYLYPDTANKTSLTYGTWTSPTYISENGVVTEGTKTGALYNSFIETAVSGIEKLRDMGYTPVIRGMWWMQGEAESNNRAMSGEYEKLLLALISDVRENLTEGTGIDCANMPFVIGNIYRNGERNEDGSYVYSQPAYLSDINATQEKVARENAGVYTVATAGLTQIDGWHFDHNSQQYLGERFVLAVANASGKFSVTAKGSYVTFAGCGAYSAGDTVTVTVTPDTNCEIVSVTYTALGETFTPTITDGAFSFTMPEGNVEITAVGIDPSATVTDYGSIPSKYTEEEYPFALFKSGELIGIYKTWYSFIDDAVRLDWDGGCTLLLRRDYTTTDCGASHNALGYVGKLTIDLGDNTFIRGDYHMFQAIRTRDVSHTTDITVINGTLKAANDYTTFIGYNASSTVSSASAKVAFNFTFTNVTFTTDATETDDAGDGLPFKGRLIAEAYSGGSVGLTSSIVLNGCTFDLSNVNIDGLFDVGDTADKFDVNIKINGGVAEGNSLSSKFNFAKLGASDSIEFGKYSGKEFTLSLAAKDSDGEVASHPVKYVDAKGGRVYFCESLNDGAKATYVLRSIDFGEGRTVSTSNLSILKYPFVLFDETGKQTAAYKNWNSYVSAAKSGYLVLRRDYDHGLEATAKPTTLSNIANLTLDLSGHKFQQSTGSSNYLIFNCIRNDNTSFTTNITVKNGTFVAGRNYAPIMIFQTSTAATVSKDTAGYNFNFNFTYENVTFTHLDSYLGHVVLQAWAGGTVGTDNTLTFNNCTFINNSGNSYNYFFCIDGKAADEELQHDFDIRVNGGTYVKGYTSSTTFKPATLSSSGDSITYGAYNGSYVKVVLPSGEAVPAVSGYKATNGKSVSFRDISDGTNAIYLLGEDVTVGDYGVIPFTNADAEAYPFAVFKGGKLLGVFGCWADNSNDSAIGCAKSNDGAVIVLRRNYTAETGTGADTFTNFSHIANLTVDLLGNTYTMASKAMFQATAKTTGSQGVVDTNVKVMNGTILAGTAAVILFNHNNASSYTRAENFTFDFEGVTFGFANGSKAIGLVAETVEYSNVGTVGVNAIIKVTDCTFNLTRDVPVFNFNDASDLATGNVTVNGGTINASALTADSVLLGSSAKDTVTFGKSGGAYVTLTLPLGVSPSGTFATANGNYKFFKSGDAYTLRPEELSGLSIKSSVTLYSDFVYNIYIPKNAKIALATLAGETVDLGKLEIIEIGGKEFYHYPVSVAASDAADTMKLELTLNFGTDSFKGAWTLSVANYAIRAAEQDASVAYLMNDILSYIRAAYVYFNTTGSVTDGELASAKALIDGYLGENYDESNAPDMSGDSSEIKTDGLDGATVELGANLSFIFYPATDDAGNLIYDIDSYVFTANGRVLESEILTDGNGKTYIKATTYAYGITGTVNYTFEGGNGYYSLKAYYVYASGEGEGSDALISIVERLYKYSESAKKYRDNALQNN